MMTLNEFKQTFHYETLDPQQSAAVAATEGPVLLLAVPGSGKTTALLARLGYLIYGRGVRPEQILTCTYTVAATEEMRTRFRAKFGNEYADRMEFRTINGVCARIISLYERQGHTAFTLIPDEGRRYGILREIWRQQGHGFPSESDLRSMCTCITYVKNQMLTDEEADGVLFGTGDGVSHIGPVYRAYKEAMRRNCWMDFDDQMVYALAILGHCPDILAQLQRTYTYFSVDEAQDTSRIQHSILALLASRSRNILMVGDEDQSIYGFRAACPQALMEFEENWPGARVLLMERNYRSTPEIVQAADLFIRLNHTRRDKRMQATRPSGDKICFQQCSSRIHQYELLANLAAEAESSRRPLAILYRNNDTALPIVDLLTRRGIPYQTRGIDGLFFTSRIVQDVRDLFRLARHPDDKPAFLRLYYKLGIFMKKAVAELPVGENGTNVFQAYLQQEDSLVPPSLHHVLSERWRQLEKLARQNNPAAAIRTMTDQMGYGNYLDHAGIDPFRLDILSMLAEKEHTIDGFLQRLDQLQQIVREGGNADLAMCTLSTIHSSKGLEYDRVVLADVVIGVLPIDPNQVKNAQELDRLEEEERRLFYVGITRAKNSLTIMAVDKCASPFVRLLQAMLNPRPRPAAFPEPVVAAPTEEEISLIRYQPGGQVWHKTFGNGIIVQRDGEYAVVSFASGERKLSLPFAVKNGLLHKVSPRDPDTIDKIQADILA